MKKSYLLIALMFVLTSCLKEPVSTEKTSNSKISVALLFELNGCKIYRFTDAGRAVYFTDCRGSIEYDVSNKNHKETIKNQTVK